MTSINKTYNCNIDWSHAIKAVGGDFWPCNCSTTKEKANMTALKIKYDYCDTFNFIPSKIKAAVLNITNSTGNLTNTSSTNSTLNQTNNTLPDGVDASNFTKTLFDLKDRAVSNLQDGYNAVSEYASTAAFPIACIASATGGYLAIDAALKIIYSQDNVDSTINKSREAAKMAIGLAMVAASDGLIYQYSEDSAAIYGFDGISSMNGFRAILAFGGVASAVITNVLWQSSQRLKDNQRWSLA